MGGHVSTLMDYSRFNYVVQPEDNVPVQLLVPGETALPGSASGKSGTPAAQTAGSAFLVTVNAVDANYNLISTITDTIGITSSDAQAILPANAPLASGTGTFAVTLKSAGARTLTVTDLSDGTRTAQTSPAIAVNAAAFTHLQLLVPGESAAPGTASCGMRLFGGRISRVPTWLDPICATDCAERMRRPSS